MLANYTLVADNGLATGRRLGAQHMLVVSSMGANHCFSITG